MKRPLQVEWMKARRSPVVWATSVLLVILLPLLAVAFLELSQGGGAGAAALKARAMVVGEGWDAYLGLAGQMLAVGMFLGPGVVAAWMFGREFADGTFPSLFALPVSRRAIAKAKFVLLIAWGCVTAALATLVVVLGGVVANVGIQRWGDLATGVGRLLVASVLAAVIASSVGLVASIRRGYLPAVGALILLVAAAQVAVLFGAGGWFPFAAPGLLAVAAPPGEPGVAAVQLGFVVLTAVVAAWATIRWWGRAEVT